MAAAPPLEPHSVARLLPESALGLQNYMDGLISYNLQHNIHDFIYCCGTQLIQYNPVTKKSVFITRPQSGELAVTALCHEKSKGLLAVGEKAHYNGAARLLNYRPTTNSTQRRTPQVNDAEDLGTQITVLTLNQNPSGGSTREGPIRTLIPQNRFCVVQNMKFLSDGTRLLSLSVDKTPNPAAKKNQSTFDYVIDLWSLTHEKVVQSVEVRNQYLTQIYTMSATQFLLSGPSYLRIWQLEPLKELDAFFSLKQEKSLKMIPGIHLMQYSEFLAGCATAKMSDDLQGNMMKSSAPQPAPVLPKISPEEDFLIIWVFCRDGTFFKFKIKERTGKTSLMEAGNIIRLLEFQDDNGTWDSQGEESAFSSRLPPKPSAVEITCVARWGLASGFILGGTCGYLGLLRFKPDEKVETLGPYWVNDVYGSEGVKWLSDYKEEDIPKKHRNTSAKTDNKFRIPDVLLLTATAREDPTADTTPTVRGQAQPKKEDVLKMYGFSVHKRDQAQQVKPVSLLFEFHGDGVLSMAAAPKGTKTLYSIGNDTALKSWTYPELSASATLTAAKATAQTGAAAVSVKTSSSSSASSSSSRAFSMEHSKIFEYDIPIQVAVHPNGLCLAVVFLDRLRLYFSCFDEIRQVWDMPLKQPSCCAFSHSGDYLAVSAMNFVLLLDIHNPKGTLVLAQYTGHLSVISQILFSVDDTLLMTCGRDGCIYGWEVASGNRIIEHVSKGSVYVAFQYDESAQEVIAVSREGDFRLIKKSTGACHLQLSHCFFNCMLLAARRNFLACGTVFGSLRVFEWPLREVDPQSNRAASTLGSGASSTSVSFQGHDRYHSIEILMHTSPVVSLALSYDHTRIFSGDESGAVFCCNLLQQSELVAFEAASSKRRRVEDEEPKTAEQLENEHWSLVLSSQKIEGLVAKEKLQAQKAKFFETQRKLQFPMRVPWTSSFDDYVLCTRQFLEDGLTEVQELRERIENVKNDAAYNIAQKEQEMDEAVSQLREEADKNMAAQASQYAQLSENMEKAQALHAETTAMKHQEMENGQRGAEQDMQNRLTKEYEKQSRLVAEIQALREKNRSDLMSLEESYEAQIEALKKHSEAAMKELRSEYDKVCAMLKTDGLKFEEAMRQQEEEYEAEISDFQDQKRSALQNESERYNGALRDMVSMKNQISSLQSQIVQNQDDLSRSAKQQDELKRKLEEVLDMFRKAQEQLKDREKVIRVKDEALQKLRSNQKHLESFRYVLFHKVQTLEKERDPLEQQVTELKDSVQGMYQEMVQDLRKKQALETRNAEKHFKIQNLVGESNVLARNLKATKKDFKNFITELTGALDIHAPAGGDASQTNNKDPTRLISQLKDVVGRYEGKVNIYRGTQELAEEEKRTGLPAITDEAIRQRDHLMEKSRAMSDATKFEQQLRARDTARFTNDNSELILEMNRLRLEKTQKDRKITELEKSMYALSSEGVGGSVMSGMPSSLLDNSLHNGSSRRGNGSMMASTPYVQRREKDEANKQRVQKRKDGNQLPPKIVTKAGGSQLTASKELHNSSQMLHSFEKEGFQVDKLRQSLPFEGVHEMSPAFDGGAGQDDIYTGGPIAPANKFPPARK